MQYQKQTIIKKFLYKKFFFHDIKRLNLSSYELNKSNKSISEDRLLSALNATELVKKVRRIFLIQNQQEMKIIC